MTEVARRLGIGRSTLYRKLGGSGSTPPPEQATLGAMRAWLPLLLLLAACRSEPSAGAESALPKSACSQRMFDGSRFTVCDPGNGRIELVAATRGEPVARQFADLEARLGPAPPGSPSP